MQAGRVWPCLISNAVASRTGCVFPPSPGQQLPPSWQEHREENPQRRRNGWMDSAQKDSCISCWGKGRDSECVLIGEEKQCFQDPAA